MQHHDSQDKLRVSEITRISKGKFLLTILHFNFSVNLFSEPILSNSHLYLQTCEILSANFKIFDNHQINRKRFNLIC